MRKLYVLGVIGLLGVIGSVSWWRVDADEPTPVTQAAGKDIDDVEVQLARAHVELAKLDLRRALEANKQIEGAYSKQFVDKLRLHVMIDEAHLEECLKGGHGESHEVCVRSAEVGVKIAEADLARTRAGHRLMPTDATAMDVERSEVVLKLAKLHLDRTRRLDGSDTLLTHMQWQIDELRHRLLELEMQR